MNTRALTLVALAAFSSTLLAADSPAGLTKGKIDLKHAGALAFGPDGVLLVADAKAAAIYAIDTGHAEGASKGKLEVKAVDQKVAAALGIEAEQLLINDMAVNPSTGEAYLSVSRGKGPDAQAVLIRIGRDGGISELALDDVLHARTALPNPPEDKVVQRGRRSMNRRTESITDIEYQDGKVLVAGLSSEEFASTFRAIPYPFKGEVGRGASVEIYHASHGGFETRSPIRAFTTYKIGDEPHLLAGYTCTPLVKFPMDELKQGSKVRGVTIAELGNRNRPLDMFVYTKGGDDYILMANSARGVMKINTKDIDRSEGLTERVRDKAGQEYETISSLDGVVQLDRLGDQAVVLIQSDGHHDLRTIDLP